MIKLTTRQLSDREREIRVEGRLDALTLDDLRSMLDACPPSGSGILDLSGLTSLDTAGRDYLASLGAEGWRMRGGSLYIKRLLEEAGS